MKKSKQQQKYTCAAQVLSYVAVFLTGVAAGSLILADMQEQFHNLLVMS